VSVIHEEHPLARTVFTTILATTLIFGTVTAAQADDDISKVNGSIRVEDGRTVGDLDSVNGSITLGNQGHAEDVGTVNGSVDIGDNATIDSASTVNGRISIGRQTRVAKDVETVNGSLNLEEGSDVSGNLSNVNGSIRLRAAHLGGGIETVNGDIEVGADSRIDGGILVEQSNSWFSFGTSKPPRVVIGPRAIVQGRLVFEREVELFVSDSARIGEVTGATPVKFSGDHP
jgi:DUF4097 and DUF4098 domain-containing protein YvlB